jgi:hypothetical protein
MSNVIAVERLAVETTNAVTLLHASSRPMPYVTIPTKIAVVAVNLLLQVPSAGQVSANAILKRRAVDQVHIVPRIRLNQMVKAAEMDLVVQVVNVPPETNSARRSWAAILKATSRMLATTATVSLAAQVPSLERVCATVCNRTFWTVLLVLVVVLART